jgi:Tfp pilus assembly protein PilF
MESLFEKSLAIKPNYCEALLNYTVFLLQSQRRDEALQVYAKAMENDCNQLPPELFL